jgi:hypothetical protein
VRGGPGGSHGRRRRQRRSRLRRGGTLTGGVERQIDRGRDNRAAASSSDREGGDTQVAKVARDQLSFDLERDDEEEQ